MKRSEVEERIRLLEYENAKLRHEVNELIRLSKISIQPLAPFARIERHSLGCSWSLPTYEQLKEKYKVV